MTQITKKPDTPLPLNKTTLNFEPDTELDDRQCSDISYFIFYNSPIGLFRSDLEANGMFLLANPELIKMFGYPSKDQLLSTPVRQLYAVSQDRDAVIGELLAYGKIEKRSVNFKKKDGTDFWGSVTAILVSDNAGRPVYIDGAVEDITESRKDIQRLIDEKTFSDSVIEAMPGLFWLHDENGRAVRWNKNVESVYGYDPDELSKLHAIKDMVTSDTLNALQEAHQRALRGHSGYCEYDIVTKYGKKIAFAGDARMMTIGGKKFFACVEIDITKRKLAEMELKEALTEIKRLKSRIEAENVYLLDEIEELSEYKNVVGQSEAFKKTLAEVKKVASTPTTTLLLGETGTGKGVLAQLIHSLSPRCERPLIKVNCANLPSTLIESILFGHEKGAFTNATSTRMGRFELANGSSIFLDEIAELPLELQSKLLRVLEEGEFERLGGTKTIHVDARIIAATNRDLESEVKAGRFRQDLLFRLNVYPIMCPPLRKRREDIEPLTRFFVRRFNQSLGKSVKEITSQTIQTLENYSWPGNIRELQNVIERGVINSGGAKLILTGSFEENRPESQLKSSFKSLKEIEYRHILSALEKTGGRIDGPKGAARLLGLHPSTLRGRMRKHGIRPRPSIPQF